MTNLILSSVMHFALAASPSDSYADAHRQTIQTGCPMVVMVGAEWCPACKQMENTVIPQARKRGVLARVAFALVDLDRDGELGRSLTAGGPIPQLIAFRRTADGWHHRKLIGGQSLEKVEAFINEELTSNEQDQKSDKAAQPTAEETATQKAKTEVSNKSEGQSKKTKVRPVSQP